MRYIFGIILLIFAFGDIANAQNVEDQFQLGKRYFKANEFVKAKKKFSFVVSKNDLYYEAYTYRARCYLELNQADSALVDFKTAIEKKNDYLPPYYYRAKYYYDQDDYSKALRDLDVVISKKSTFMPAVLLRADIYEKQGKEELAFKDYSSAILNGTKNAKVFYRRALYYSKKSMHTKALADLAKAISYKPKYTDAWFLKGVELQFIGQNRAAISAYSQCIKLDIEYKTAYERRAYLYSLSKDYEAAIADNDFLIKHFRVRSDTLYIRNAKDKISIKDFTSADRDLIRAQGVNSKSEEALILRAEISIAKERPSTALSYLQRTTRINPKNEQAWFMIGKIFYNQEIFDKAIDNLGKSISAKKTGEAYYLRGACYAALKDKTNACSDTQKAAELGHLQAKKDVTVICR